jgi:hypothetical protein
MELAKQSMNTRYDPKELEQKRAMVGGERFAVLLRGGGGMMGTSVVLKQREFDNYMLTADPCKLVQTASLGEVPLFLVPVAGTKKSVKTDCFVIAHANTFSHLLLQSNQAACWLMIELEDGFAADEYQSGLGDMLCIRGDGLDFVMSDWMFCHDFASHMLDIWGDGKRPDYEKEWKLHMRAKKHQFAKWAI